MSSIHAIAVSGMSAAQSRLQASAHNIANLNTADFRRQQVVQAADVLGGVSTSVVQAQQRGHAAEAGVWRHPEFASTSFLSPTRS